MMKRFAVVALSALVACGGSPSSATHRARATPCTTGATDTIGSDIALECIAPGVWMFTVLAPADFELPDYPANGLVVEASDHAVLVDTTWNDAQAIALVEWSALPITGALATHSHRDRTGGARALIARGIPVYGTAQTIELARANGDAVPNRVLEEGSLPELRWYYPGPAHAPDNVVVWLEPSRTLYGGCMIKDLAAESLGNVADADPLGWLSALDGIELTFPDPAMVVPGHGARGDASLLAHTRELLGPRECTSAADCAVTIEALETCACCNCVEPRALSLRAIEAAREMMLSCEPVCAVECPPCTSAAELATYVAACELGTCALRRR